MKTFKDFNITPSVDGFTGDKIKTDRILNRQIVVHDYKIEDSKYGEPGKKCLHLQISIGETKHVVFTGSKTLINLIQQVSKQDMPFKATVIKDNERLIFT